MNKKLSLKKFLFSTLFFSIFINLPSFGQKNDKENPFRHKTVISFSLPLKMKFETPISDKFTTGGILKIYGSRYQPGVTLSPIFRFYPDGVYNQFFIQARGCVGYHEIEMTYFKDLSIPHYNNEGGIIKNYKTFAFGGGIDIGVQVPFGKFKDNVFEISIGYNFYPFPEKIPTVITERNTNYYTIEKYGREFVPGMFLIPEPQLRKENYSGKGLWEYMFGGAGVKLYHCVSLGYIF